MFQQSRFHLLADELCPAHFFIWSTGLRWVFFVFMRFIQKYMIFYYLSLDITPLDYLSYYRSGHFSTKLLIAPYFVQILKIYVILFYPPPHIFVNIRAW